MRGIVGMSALLGLMLMTSTSTLADAIQAGTPGPRASNAQSTERIDLNTADQEALEALPGIGPRTAERIIEYRSENGGLKKVEELMNVRGIGERTFLRLRELVTVTTASQR